MNEIRNLHLIFRIACAMCFIGHGAFGIITKPIWCNYFGVFGIGEVMAYQLMPVVGIADIIFGIMFIVYPVRAVAGWLVIWGLFTASLRPLSGEPFAEFIERAGNYGAPLVLLLLSGPIPTNIRGWFQKMQPQALDEEGVKRLTLWLRVFGCTLLIGHGWLNIIEKGGLLKQYASIGIGNAVLTAHVVGAIEIIGALVILVRPLKEIVLVLFLWKMASEVLHPAYPFFEWVERGGSYAILLGLWLVLRPTFNTAMRTSITTASILLLTWGCSSSTLSNDDAKKLLEDNKAYPHAIEAKIFINEEETAQRILETDLDEQGFLTAQPTHTREDIGQSLVHFTEKAAPYLLPKPDSVESIEIQLVRVGDEVLSQVTSVSYSGDKSEAEVTFETRVENVTPFAVLLRSKLPETRYYKTTFTRAGNEWQWRKNIVNLASPR